ncbi:hypothetical protein L1887_54062 [Cichorium endivia]|nr:hypothetical protein L1887_54062 [Cichorium endivia]
MLYDWCVCGMRDGGGEQKRASLTASQAGDFECHHLQSAPPKAHTKRHTHTRTRTPKQQTEASDTEARLAGWLAWALLGAAKNSKPTAQRAARAIHPTPNSAATAALHLFPYRIARSVIEFRTLGCGAQKKVEGRSLCLLRRH